MDHTKYVRKLPGRAVRVCILRCMDGFEKFPQHELKTLHDELKQAGLDSFQVGELLAGFLVQHGYGVSTAQARSVGGSIEVVSCTLPRLQEELEKLAMVM